MKLKSCLLVIAALSLAGQAMAQDKIYKRDGSVIEAKVLEVGTRTIKYKRAGNTEGPDFVIGKNEIDKIRYENGTEDFYGDRRRPMPPSAPGARSSSRSKEKYGNNIIAANPLQIMESGESSSTGNGPGFGFGISYERVLDKNGVVSFYLPAYMGFTNTANNTFSPGGPPITNRTFTTFYVMPGLKLYPTGQGLVKYAVGPSAAIITGQRISEVNLYDQNGNYIGRGSAVVDRFTFGLAINNSLNISPTPHLYLGLEMALGFSYINQVNNVNSGTVGIFQFGFKAGYRF